MWNYNVITVEEFGARHHLFKQWLSFKGKLEVTKTYLSSNASVREAKPKYRKTDDEIY